MSAKIIRFRQPYSYALQMALNAVSDILEEPVPARQYIQNCTNIIEDLVFGLAEVNVADLQVAAPHLAHVTTLMANLCQHVVNETTNKEEAHVPVLNG